MTNGHVNIQNKREIAKMENYIVINGKKAELTEEQLEKLGIKPEKNKYREIFDIEQGDTVYFIQATGAVSENKYEIYDIAGFSTRRNIIGNCCKDKEIMQQRALHETLDRLLWRASVIAGELDNPWDMSNAHYYIYRDFDSDCLKIDCDDSWKNQGVCYFPTKESAKAVIENIIKPFIKEHPDFKW